MGYYKELDIKRRNEEIKELTKEKIEDDYWEDLKAERKIVCPKCGMEFFSYEEDYIAQWGLPEHECIKGVENDEKKRIY